MQKSLIAKNHSLLAAKLVRYSLQKFFAAKNHLLLVVKFARCSLQKWSHFCSLKWLQHRSFSCNFLRNFKNTFSVEHLPTAATEKNIKMSTDFLQFLINWSRHQRCSIMKGILRNFAKFTGRQLCQSLFLNKFAGLWHSCFPVNFAKFLRTPFLQNTSGRLLLLLRNCFWLNWTKYRSSCSRLLLRTDVLKCFRETPVVEVCNFSERFL